MSSLPFDVLSHCPGCGSRSISLASPPTLWRCRCGLFFQNPRPRLKEIRAYYDRGLTYRRFQREKGVRDRLWARRLRLVRRFRPSGRLLDVGTGDGHFLELARSHFEAEGTEVSAAGVRLARGRGLEVLHGALEELSLPPHHYDVITLWHVFEHLTAPSSELERIAGLVAPGGYLFVAVPNETRALDALGLTGRWRSTPFSPGAEIHLTHFTPRVLSELLCRHGFEVVRLACDDVDTCRSIRSRMSELAWTLAGALLWRRWHTAVVAVARAPARTDG